VSRQDTTVRRIGTLLGVIAVVAALVAVAVVVLHEPPQRRVTAYFERAVGLHPGSDVRILGMRVGKVTKVTPRGDTVKVEMTYEARYKVPADVQAVIVNQTLVADRFVQLAPAYKGTGPTLPDNATLGTDRTHVPVEVDEVGGSLNDLSKALGPEGANADGSLSRLLQVSAETFEGQGEDLRQTIADTSRMLSTLSEDRDDVAATIRNLQIVTAAMVRTDRQIRQFNQDLAAVSSQLAQEREELSAALNTLGPTLRNVQRFIKDNRERLGDDVEKLAQITAVLVKQRKSFAEFLETAPMAINNLARAYDPISGTIGTRANLSVNFSNLADWICSLAYSVGTPAKQCLDFMKPYDHLGDALTHLSLDLSWITALTTHYDPEPIPRDAYGPDDPRNPRKGGGGVLGGKKAGSGGAASNSGGDAQQRDFRSLLPGGGR